MVFLEVIPYFQNQNEKKKTCWATKEFFFVMNIDFMQLVFHFGTGNGEEQLQHMYVPWLSHPTIWRRCSPWPVTGLLLVPMMMVDPMMGMANVVSDFGSYLHIKD